MSLKEKLDVLKAGSTKKFSQEIRQTMQQSLENIYNSGITQRFQKTGDKAPDFQTERCDSNLRYSLIE